MEMHVMTIQINNLSRSILWTFDQLDNTKADNLQESLNDTKQQFFAEKYNKLHFFVPTRAKNGRKDCLKMTRNKKNLQDLTSMSLKV